MSRIGNRAIMIPSGVTVNVAEGEIQVKGPKVTLRGPLPAGTTGSGRLELAAWLIRPDHPLTARVMVNRIWQHHFGEGLVRTPDNFGMLSANPTELGDRVGSGNIVARCQWYRQGYSATRRVDGQVDILDSLARDGDRYAADLDRLAHQ